MTPEQKLSGAPLMQMKIKMIEELETFLRSKVADSEKQKIAIADINFALRNGWLFKLLRKRGNAIKWKNWE